MRACVRSMRRFVVPALMMALVSCVEECEHADADAHSTDTGSNFLQLEKATRLRKVFQMEDNEDINIVPAPVKLTRMDGALLLGQKPLIAIEASSEQSREAFKVLVASLLKGASVSASGSGLDALVKLHIDKGSDLAAEGYRLKVTPTQVAINASTEHGLFNGLISLRQLLQEEEGKTWSVPAVEIEDAPAFAWRGLMLDVSRHFFPPEDVKRLLKTMASFKLNHFHWHLTDDQGWRFPVEKYPKLISLGAARRATQLGHDKNRNDDTPYNHSYSEEDIEGILHLADFLHIEVVPEFDMPGHSEALIASYPEMGNADSSNPWNPQVGTQFGAFEYTLAPSEKAVGFAKDVVSELAQVFERSSYVHLGGDEASTSQWMRSAAAGKVAHDSGISVHDLEGMMLEQVVQHLDSLKRHAIVWDEAIEGRQLPKGTVAMLWRSWIGIDQLGSRARSKGYPVVLTPQDHTYLDQFQAEGGRGEKYDANSGYLPLSKVYETPTSAGGAEVLGMQAQLWSEYINQGGANLDYMAWPRGSALAEVAWCGQSKPGFKDFKRRLSKRLGDFDRLEVHYRKLDGM
eukprot:TRINITY_DN6261_c0_g1_i1.p1 TRINITY_DN6261_c0_g1~~TRINITY_DN6261_c0_g1_i1.p1  ORF type:complete len:573 (-),score=138.13 TRINITY_DN6261_c0_g1_i1:68-1786(-)